MKRVVLALLVLVMLNSVMSPVMAANTTLSTEKQDRGELVVYELKTSRMTKRIIFHSSVTPRERQAILLKMKLFLLYNGSENYTNIFDELTEKDYSIIIEAVSRASIFSIQERNEIKEKVNQIKLNGLNESDQGELLLKILAALQDYTMQFKGVKLKDLVEGNSKDKSVTIQWTPGDHITLTKYSLLSLKNVFGKNIPDSRINTISEAADDPDSPPWNNYDHYGSLAVYNVGSLSDLAEIYYSNGNIQAGDETLGKATHYMCDLGNPWHAVGLLRQDIVTHVMYEDWVNNRLRNGWYDYLANLNWIVISSPSTLANDLKDTAESKYDRLHWIMISDPNWENNLELQVTTSILLEETVAHNMGLIEYVID